MSVRLRYSAKVQISSRTDPEDKDLGNLSYENVTDSNGEGGSRKFTLAAGDSDIAIDLGNVTTPNFVFIRSSAKDPLDTPSEITVKRNTIGNEEIPITPISGTKTGWLLLSTSGLTALFASNPGSVDMELIVAVSGD